MQRIVLIILSAFLATQAFAFNGGTRVDIYDRNQRSPLPVFWHEGKAWVVGTPGHEYQITVRNNAHNDVLAVVSIDGVNVINGQTAAASQSGYVIDAQQSVALTGWRKSMQQTARFYFTALSDSYAARTGRPHNVGVIGVAVFARKRQHLDIAQRPHSPNMHDKSMADSAGAQENEHAAPAMAARGRRAEHSQSLAKGAYQDKLGTGHGQRETSYARHVAFERASTYPNEQIEIYYDSYQNLVARGVIRNQHKARLPQAFPGEFVPDPQR